MSALHFPTRRALLALALAVPLVVPLGCGGDRSTAPTDNGALASLAISANLAGTTVSTLVVTVTAPDIPTPIVQNIEATNNFASGTIKMPPGNARTITVQAFASTGEVAYEGAKTIDVKPGNNPPISIPMTSQGGHVPITVQIGDVSIVITPASATIAVGGTQQLIATIRAPNGDVVTDPPEWATTDPTIASVSATGLVTGRRVGSADIVASYSGIAAKVTITVQSGGQAPTANAGADQWVSMGTVATLNGSASSGVSGPLAYRWTQVSGPDVTGGAGTLSGVSPTFAAPAQVRTLSFDLVVTDGNGASAPDRVNVTVLEGGPAMFVSAAGSDVTGNGSRALPFATIQHAVTAAAATIGGGSTAAVYVGDGTFAAFTLSSSVSVYGGFLSSSWTRATPLSGTNVVATSTGVSGLGVTNLSMDGLSIASGDGVAPGESSYGIRLASSTGIRLSNLHITAGRGANGSNGATGSAGLAGGAGVIGQGGSSGSSNGGLGGSGGIGVQAGGGGGLGGYDAGNGQAGFFGGGGTPGGSGGAATGACLSPSGRGGNGAQGADGPGGVVGSGGTAFGAAVGGSFVGSNGASGNNGIAGAGGGGGGGGGGGAAGVFCNADRGGGGGGGGAGGGPGTGGGGGTAGGSSLGILLTASTVTLFDQIDITVSTGGTGGAGAAGGAGAIGGAGAPGGSGADDSGGGGNGGPGGTGGPGGSGGGGAGGHSIGVLQMNGSVIPSGASPTYHAGTAGTGGAGGPSAPSGANGTSAAVSSH